MSVTIYRLCVDGDMENKYCIHDCLKADSHFMIPQSRRLSRPGWFVSIRYQGGLPPCRWAQHRITSWIETNILMLSVILKVKVIVRRTFVDGHPCNIGLGLTPSAVG